MFSRFFRTDLLFSENQNGEFVGEKRWKYFRMAKTPIINRVPSTLSERADLDRLREPARQHGRGHAPILPEIYTHCFFESCFKFVFRGHQWEIKKSTMNKHILLNQVYISLFFIFFFISIWSRVSEHFTHCVWDPYFTTWYFIDDVKHPIDFIQISRCRPECIPFEVKLITFLSKPQNWISWMRIEF